MPALQASVIETGRLRLALMTEGLLAACLEGDPIRAHQLAGFQICDEWLANTRFIERKLDQCRSDPRYAPWCVRAIVLQSANEMIGHIGFHESPDAAHLRSHGPNTAEFGYTIYAKHRGQGYATEAARGLMIWAARDAGIERFVLSIAPGNAASQAIARHFGFKKAGEQMDEIDGLEEVFLLEALMLLSRSAGER